MKILRLLWPSALIVSLAWGAQKPDSPVLRWAEGQPGCTFSADDDGRYRYGLWTDTFGVVLAVDSQELEKSIRRTVPTFAILLTFHQRGSGALPVKPASITLEFVKHEHNLQNAIDPDALTGEFQREAAESDEETQREIAKHPSRTVEMQAELEAHKKDVEQMVAFIKTRSLREVRLDSAHPVAEGWVFFHARNKWIGDWNKQEELVLRMSVADREVEFPFLLPPSKGDFLLRRRP